MRNIRAFRQPGITSLEADIHLQRRAAQSRKTEPQGIAQRCCTVIQMGRGGAAAANGAAAATGAAEGTMKLPVVDISRPEAEAAATLRDCCEKHGFYYLT